jgi:NDP-sugar pyrophosphorylase family protein
MSERAIVLAGGMGSRLRPYTVVLPKPLMPIGSSSILELIVKQLAHAGFQRVTMAVNHQANIIRALFGDGSQWGLLIDYSLESKPLSTIAPLLLIEDLPATFLLMNGDVLTDLDFGAFLDGHTRAGSLFTIAASRRSQLIDFGVLHASPEGLLEGFEEKPRSEYLVSMGVYAVSRDMLRHVPPDAKFGFDDLMWALLKAGERVSVHEHRGYWLDIGRPDDYHQAIEEFEANPGRFLGSQ